MKKQLKNYRIVSTNGEALLISQKRFHYLLQTLDVLARNDYAARERKRVDKKSAMTGD